MAEQQRPAQREQNPFDDQRAKLYAQPVQGSSKRPTLTFGIVTRKFTANMASITVKTQVPDDKNFGKIEAVIAMKDMYGLLEQVKRVAMNSGPTERTFRIYIDFAMGKKADKPFPGSAIQVGKEEDGRVYLSVTAKNRPAIKFHICPDEFFRQVVDGVEQTTEETYQCNAMGYVQFVSGIYAHLVPTKFVGWYPDGGGQGGNGNSGNGGGGNSGSGNGGGGSWGGDDNSSDGGLW